MRLPKDFVVKELISYFGLYESEPAYQRNILDCWRMNRDEGPYSGAYREAVKRIESDGRFGAAS